MAERIAVVGAGPVGTCLAAHLAWGGHDVTLCDVRGNLLRGVEDEGLHVEGLRTLSARHVRVTEGVHALASDPPPILFLAVKAPALSLLASALQEFVRPHMTVVSWQNGIETELILAETLGRGVVVRAIVNYGATLLRPGRVKLDYDHAPHLLKEVDPASREKAEELVRILCACGLKAERTDDLLSQVWRKTIMNSALNPVCALTSMTMAQAVNDPFVARLTDGLLKEGIRVARANEIELGWDFYRWAVNYIRSGGDHKPSMLVDLEQGGRTEVDFICGKIVEFGEAAGVDTPNNRTVHALVKALERRYAADIAARSRDDEQGAGA